MSPLGLSLGADDTDLVAMMPEGSLVITASGVRDHDIRDLLQAARSGLAVSGDARNEIGYWLAPALALAARASEVTRLYPTRGVAKRSRGERFVASEIPFAAAQLALSGMALLAQASAAATLRKPQLNIPPRRGGSDPRAVYVRSVVGTSAHVGGAITHTHEVIRALAQLGVDVVAITNDRWIAETAASEIEPPCVWKVVEDARVLRGLPASASVGVDIALVRAALTEARAADFIYQRHARFSLCGALLARLSGRPLILEYNGSEAWVSEHWQPTPLAGQLARCERAALAAAARIVVVSAAEQRTLERQGISPERIVVNPNGVNPERFMKGGGEEVRRQLGLADSELVFGFVGTFGPWHGVPVLARAFGELAMREPNARLLLVGSGDELEEVRVALAEAGCAERVRFVDRVPPDEVPSHLDACDVLVSPHVWREGTGEFFGSPTKLFEYMAAGKAIVASRLGQIGEVLIDDESALLCEPGNVQELATAMIRTARDPDLRGRLGAAARQSAVNHHTWALNGRRVLDAYADLVNGSNRIASVGGSQATRVSKSTSKTSDSGASR